jgi:arylsulfatase A-like enzyme
MVLTSLVLHEHGHSLFAIAVSHTFHSAGMFAFTIPIGKLADRYGRSAIMFPGVFISLIGAALVSFTPNMITVTLGTFLVGLGWAGANVAATAYIADKVIDYLRLRRKEDWLIHAVFLRPHPPLIAPAPYDRLIDTNRPPKPVRLESRDAEAARHPYLKVWLDEMSLPGYFDAPFDLHALPESDRDEMRAVYFGLIAEVDAQIGRIIDHLKATGEYDETLIIFTSDHGEMLGDHWCWGKGGFFDGSNHIPLIIRDPETPAGSRGRQIDAFTESVDLMPTILDWIGSPVPHENNGHSLAPFLAGGEPDLWRKAAFWEFDFRNPVSRRYETALGLSPDECTMNVIRDRDFKYVHFTSLPPLLFDLRADPGECVNLAEDPAQAGTVARYAQKLLSHRLLHAERTLTNAMLSPQGVIRSDVTRGTPDMLYGATNPGKTAA